MGADATGMERSLVATLITLVLASLPGIASAAVEAGELRKLRVTGDGTSIRDAASRQWHLENVGQDDGIPDADIDAEFVRQVGRSGDGVTVAVIDTGIQPTHPDLRGQLWVNPREKRNRRDDDGNGFVDDINGIDLVDRDSRPWDEHGHGTWVSGIIAAKGHKAVGVAPGVKIMMIRALNENGVGEDPSVPRAVNYAIRNGAKIINLSIGFEKRSPDGERAMLRAERAGVLVTAAAGNDGRDNDRVPWAVAGHQRKVVVSVASTSRFDQVSGFSNYGARNVELAAPGEEIFSTWKGSRTATADGTSAAAPVAAGVAALLASDNPHLSGAQLRDRLIGGVAPLPPVDPEQWDEGDDGPLKHTMTDGRLAASNALVNSAKLDGTIGRLLPPGLSLPQDIQDLLAALGL